MVEKKNAPEIRFPGFTDDWEQRKVGEWGNFYYGHSCPKWSVTEDATTPCIRYGEMYTKFGCKIDRVYSYTNIPKENLKFSKGTEVLVPRVGEDPMDYNHCTWLSLANVAIGEMISVYNTEQNPLFTAIMFNATLKYEFAKRVEGGSVTNLYYEKLLEIPVSFPNIEEQKKIASLFENLDSLITLHQRECEKWKELKKRLLQKMFPKHGESVPEIRFPGFTDNWEQRKFGDLGSVAMCKRIFKEQTTATGEIPFYKIGTFGGEPDAFISRDLFEEYKAKFSYPEVGDMLISASGTIGRTVEYTGKDEYFQDSNIVWFKHDDRIDNSFLRCLYSIVEWSGIEGSTIKRLYNDNFLKTKFMLPCVAEQRKVGSFFSHLETLITLHQRELEKWKELKKGLLQQMFV